MESRASTPQEVIETYPLAEGEGFEPPVLIGLLFSRQSRSTTPPPFHTMYILHDAGGFCQELLVTFVHQRRLGRAGAPRRVQGRALRGDGRPMPNIARRTLQLERATNARDATPTIEGERSPLPRHRHRRAILGTNIFRDFFASIRDIVGGRSNRGRTARARRIALRDGATGSETRGRRGRGGRPRL